MESVSSLQFFHKLATIYVEGLLHLLQLPNDSDAEIVFFQVFFHREILAGEQPPESKLFFQ